MIDNFEAPERFRLTVLSILAMLLLWCVLYVEPLSLAGFKISKIWKAIVVGILFCLVIKKRHVPIYSFFGILFALKFLVYIYIPHGYLKAVQDCLESIIFPLVLSYLFTRYAGDKYRKNRLMAISLWLSLFMIFSSVPFIFGLDSLNPVRDLKAYGLEGRALSGIFYSISGSSKIFCISTIVVLFSYQHFSKTLVGRTLWLIAVGLGVYSVYASWTRTGWFMFLIALVVGLSVGADLRRRLLLAITLLSIVLLVSWLYETDQAFRWRMSGGATYRTQTELGAEQLLNARLPFVYTAIGNLKDEGVGAQLIGYGTKYGTELFEKKMRMSISSHNRTFEILESSGFIGLLFYICFVALLFVRIFNGLKYSSFDQRRLAIVSSSLYFGFFAVSHGMPFWGELIVAPIFMLVILNYSSRRNFGREVTGEN